MTITTKFDIGQCVWLCWTDNAEPGGWVETHGEIKGIKTETGKEDLYLIAYIWYRSHVLYHTEEECIAECNRRNAK